jgi:hypothetical protein
VHGAVMSTQAVVDTIEQLHEGMARLGDRPPPEPVDRDFERLARSYWTAHEETRAAIRAAVADRDRMLILNLGYRATQLALWDRDALHLQDALAGHCIEGFLWDARDNLVRLAPIWYVAEELGISASELFSNAAERATAEAAKWIREFAASPSSLRSMGLEIVEENGRSVIQPIPPAWRRPPPARKPKGRK